MRLAQLARKIAVKPSEISAFLASKNINIEDSSNAKINDDHVILIMQHFAPEMMVSNEDTADVLPQPTEAVGKIEEKIEVEMEDLAIRNEVADDLETLQEDEADLTEVIKAPKVELPGLKVVGKIELPEPKKKEEDKTEPTEVENDGQVEDAPRRQPRPERRRNIQVPRQNDRGSRKNPVALQREREEREALRKRQEEKNKEKEQRTQRYLKKVSTKIPTPKPARRNKHEDEYEVFVEEQAKPKSFVGKILRWFVSE